MATVIEPKQKSERPLGIDRAPPRRSRWMRKAGVAVALLVLLVWLIPVIIAHSSLRNQVLAGLLPGLNGTIAAGSASLGWFSPVAFYDIEIRNPEGELLIELPSLSGDRSLWRIVGDSSQLGHFTAEQLHVHLALRDDGSNAEDVLLPWWNTPTSAAGMDCAIEVVDGQVSLDHVATGEKWTVDKLEVAIDLIKGQLTPQRLEMQAGLAPAGDPTRRGTVALKLQAESAGGKLHLQTDKLAAAALQPFLRRAVAGLEAAGTVTSTLEWQWPASAEAETTLAGNIVVEDLALAGPPLGADRLRLARLEAPCSLAWKADRVQVRALDVNCDVGRLSIQGSAPRTGGPWTELLGKLAREDWAIDGRFDIARLATLLPNTLRIREGTQMTAGQVSLTAASKAAAEGRQWNGKLEIAGLAATNAGRQLRWEKPVIVTLAADDTGRGVHVQRLGVESEFLGAELSGQPGEFTGSAQMDLDRLQRELSQFIDLGDVTLAGRGRLDLQWRRGEAGAFQAGAAGQFTLLKVVLPGRQPWVENSLNLSLVAEGQAAGPLVKRVDRLTLNAAAGADRLDAQLTEPVLNPGLSTVWPLTGTLQGDLARWAPRLQPVVDLSGWDLRGDCHLQAAAQCSSAAIDIAQAKLDVQQLHAWGPGLYIDEPAVQAELRGQWDSATGKLTLGKTTLATSALAAGTESVTVEAPAGGPLTLAGVIDFRGDLGRLYGWTSDPRVAATWRPVGQLSGRVDLHQTGSVTAAELSSTIEELAVYRAQAGAAPASAEPVWREARVDLALAGDYDASKDMARLSDLSVGAEALRVKAAGQIDKLTTTRDANLSGQVDYDLAVITALLKPYVGEKVQLAGQESRSFSLRGPLDATWPEKLVAQAEVGWQAANVYGLPIGASAVQAKLESGTVGIAPMDIQVAEGRLTAAPSFRLNATPMELTLPKGPLLSQVRISPEICEQGLKFVAPALADATRAEGRFSIDLDGARVPLDDPTAAEAVGRLAVSSVEVNAGPLAQTYILFAKQVEALVRKQIPPTQLERQYSLLRLDEQNINFQVANRRVYHQAITMQADNMTIRTYGSVGFDETLSLAVEIPLKQEWLNANPLLASLKIDAIRAPIQGTLRQPRLDRRALEQLTQQLLQSGANELINEGLNRLLRPR